MEYQGYTGRTSDPIDFSALSGELIDAVQGTADRRQARKDELEKITTELEKSTQS